MPLMYIVAPTGTHSSMCILQGNACWHCMCAPFSVSEYLGHCS